jgi:prophage regulatory protein
MDIIIKSSDQKIHATIKFYRVNQLIQILSISKSTIWSWVNKGVFPKPHKLGENVTVWSAEEVDEWIKSRLISNK